MTSSLSDRDVLRELIAQKDIAPAKKETFDFIETFLKELGFTVQRLRSAKGRFEVENIYARYGTEAPNFCFAGHVDVVPPGDMSQWESDPFALVEKNGHLFGRGVADMKGGVAASLCAVRAFLKKNKIWPGSLSFLITGDEETDAIDGTAAVLEELQKQKETIDICLLGEPSCDHSLGDGLKIGRRGSANISFTFNGLQHHAGYANLPASSISAASTLVQILSSLDWEAASSTPDRSGFFPPTHISFVGMDSPHIAFNVTTPCCRLDANIRYTPSYTMESLKALLLETTQKALKPFKGVEWFINFVSSGDAFYAPPSGSGIQATLKAIKTVTGRTPELNGRGGTSDGRFLAPYVGEIFEFGLLNQTIHRPNECIPTEDYDGLIRIYMQTLENVFIL